MIYLNFVVITDLYFSSEEEEEPAEEVEQEAK
jgi:hypothetical protein